MSVEQRSTDRVQLTNINPNRRQLKMGWQSESDLILYHPTLVIFMGPLNNQLLNGSGAGLRSLQSQPSMIDSPLGRLRLVVVWDGIDKKSGSWQNIPVTCTSLIYQMCSNFHHIPPDLETLMHFQHNILFSEGVSMLFVQVEYGITEQLLTLLICSKT